MGILSRLFGSNQKWGITRFTDRARKTMALANREARDLRHPYIDTEHILLGLLREGSGSGVAALERMGVDPGALRAEMERILVPGEELISNVRVPQTNRAKNVIRGAIEEARGLGHEHIGTEHLLLAMVRGTEGVAGRILRASGVALEAARAVVSDLSSK